AIRRTVAASHQPRRRALSRWRGTGSGLPPARRPAMLPAPFLSARTEDGPRPELRPGTRTALADGSRGRPSARMWLLMRRPAQSGYWRSALRLLPAVSLLVWHFTCPPQSASAQSFAIRLREVFGLTKPGPASPPNWPVVSPLGEVE